MYGILIHLHEYHKNQPNEGKYTSPMDPMGTDVRTYQHLLKY